MYPRKAIETDGIVDLKKLLKTPPKCEMPLGEGRRVAGRQREGRADGWQGWRKDSILLPLHGLTLSGSAWPLTTETCSICTGSQCCQGI